jgi:ribose-phosphate pyrophosphokinase
MLKVFAVHSSGHTLTGEPVTGRQELDVKTIKFKGGEMHPTVYPNGKPVAVHIQVHLTGGDDVMELLLVTDAVKRLYPMLPITLIMPYVPYARQDRVANHGEAHGLKVFCKLINDQGYARVVVQDPHSDVATALLDNVVVDEAYSAIEEAVRKIEARYGVLPALVSPDAGARKRTLKIAHYLGGLQVVFADKVRDTKTLEITATEIHGDMPDAPLLVVDDICDGGRTFIELAKAVRKLEAVETTAGETALEATWPMRPMFLYVTHGIFSYGAELLLEHYTSVFTRNNWTDDTRVIDV